MELVFVLCWLYINRLAGTLPRTDPAYSNKTWVICTFTMGLGTAKAFRGIAKVFNLPFVRIRAGAQSDSSGSGSQKVLKKPMEFSQTSGSPLVGAYLGLAVAENGSTHFGIKIGDRQTGWFPFSFLSIQKGCPMLIQTHEGSQPAPRPGGIATPGRRSRRW